MTLDVDVVRGRCAEIEQSLARLDPLRSIGREGFLADPDAQDIACHRLLVAVEAALALCCHVAARRLRAVPEDYAGCFKCLEQGHLPASDVSERLQRMARFRNLLVHVDWTLDYDRVFDVLERDLGDPRAFARAMAARV